MNTRGRLRLNAGEMRRGRPHGGASGNVPVHQLADRPNPKGAPDSEGRSKEPNSLALSLPGSKARELASTTDRRATKAYALR